MTTTITTAHVAAEIRKATAAETRRVAGPLAQAFFDDPVFSWVTPDDEKRRRLLTGFFELFAATLIVHDESYLAGDAGSAIWVGPGRRPVPEETVGDFVAEIATLSGDDADRMLEVAELIDAHHPQGSFYFLQFVGVLPDRQGRGIGSALLTHVLARCDEEGVPAYLDATSRRNKALYERHGFRPIGEYGPAWGPPLWQMWREPGG